MSTPLRLTPPGAEPAGFRVSGPSQLDGVVVVSLEGELDLAGVDRFEKCLRAAEDGPGRLVIDLRKLTFLDSTGLSALVACHRRLREAGVRGPVVVTEDEGVARLLRMTRLDEILDLRPAIPSRSGLEPDGAVG